MKFRGWLKLVMAVSLLAMLVLNCATEKATPAPAAPKAAATSAPATAAAVQPKPAAVVPTPAAAAVKPSGASAPAAQVKSGAIPGVSMPKFLRFKGMSSPGTYYDLLTKPFIQNVESVFTDLRVRELPGGSKDAVVRIETGDCDAGVTIVSDPYWGWFGGTPRAKELWGYDKPYRRQRTMAMIPNLPQGGVSVVVLKDSKFHTLKDLIGARVNPGMATHSTRIALASIYKQVYGIEWPKDHLAAGGTVYWGLEVDAIELMKSGKLDAVTHVAAHPYGPLSELHLTKGIRVLNFTDAEAKAFGDPVFGSVGYVGTPMAKDTYSGHPQVQTVMTIAGYYVSKDMPDDVVYNLLWAHYGEGRWKKLQEVHPAHKGVDYFNKAGEVAPVPWHPGAVKFWKDQGVKLDSPLSETNIPPGAEAVK